jgi:GH25 family lysozyme M1 (1,4-beta-N-acetylmuramidase)
MGSQIAEHEGSGGPSGQATTFAAGAGPATRFADAQTPGLDVSHWQGRVNWPGVARMGARFAYVKATEGTGYRDPTFSYQYNGSFRAGLLRGAYHFALPHVSTGTAQANYFVNHGGAWSRDGRTLPGALDIEYNPYGKTCYGKSKVQMANWIKGFSRQYQKRTGRWPVIYTSANWWALCVGTAYSFHRTSPLWIARYNSYIGGLPFDWPVHTIWQFNNAGRFPGDQNRFNGTLARVRALARG